ncbi:SpoVR family protein [Desulfatitalea tepidiphila]|uniref:SpoVR family protein n=1 Tax=Desulfatitalea tepidiphila TaxID=1185843 RepID=UPI0006B53E0F|nr:SpoVR family protein [Desulfatitalea tepidiphila]
MELIDQHTKDIMEGCKTRAREAGLRFEDESLEYVVTNRDLLELSPKLMIPTLYDYWVHDVEVLKGKGKYELYPSNPYETVINTRPAISYYNDNNPDWLNVMIFYHVLAHIDFFQNNIFFRHTWDYDFTGEALSDKRVIAKLRSEHGRWVDYVIEFSRSIDNLVGYYQELENLFPVATTRHTLRLDYYFDIFLQDVKKVKTNEYIKEIERYNQCRTEIGELFEDIFFAEVDRRYPEFKALLAKYKSTRTTRPNDLLQHILAHSEFVNKEENKWMKTIIEIVRKTSLFFQPQIRTKIMNEGWASYWHETLFLQDDRIRGHEVEFARVNAGVTAMPRVGLNPYALGMRLFYDIEEAADKGKLHWDFQRLNDAHIRDTFDTHAGNGREYIFYVRENLSDFNLIHQFVTQDFVNRHRLFVAGRRLNESKMVWEYYVKSRDAEAYRDMLRQSLYHPPTIVIDYEKGKKKNALYLIHTFEEKPLLKDFIPNTLLGIEYLWGGPVMLETHELAPTGPRSDRPRSGTSGVDTPEKPELRWQRVVYSMENRQIKRQLME